MDREAILKRVAEVNSRVGVVAEKLRQGGNRACVGDVCEGEWVSLDGYFNAEDLRALANAIDGQDDANLAMFKDLKEESKAYQRGLEDGIETAIEELDAHRLDNVAQLLRERIGSDRTV